MNTPAASDGKWTERSSRSGSPLDRGDAFSEFFKLSADAMLVFDAQGGELVDSNQAAADLLHCQSRAQLMNLRLEALAPALQPDGRASSEKASFIRECIQKQGSFHFDWQARRFDGDRKSVV